MNLFKLFLIVIVLSLSFTSCEKKRVEPYDIDSRLPSFSAVINSYSLKAEIISIFKPYDLSYIRVLGKDSLYKISIGFPMDCGEKTFSLPSTNPNFFMLFNNIEGEAGKLTITKYDINLVYGEFEFETNKDSTVTVSKGNFEIIYGVD